VASRTADNVNVDRLRRASVPIADAPQVQIPVNTNAGKALFSIGEMLRQTTKRVEDRLDIIAKVEGSKAGTLAGMDNKLPELMDDATIRGEAFNASAKDAAITRLSLAGRLKLNELEQKYTADPAGFKENATGYLKGVTPELMSFDPALAQRYAADYTIRAEGVLNQVKDRRMAIDRDKMLENSLREQLAVADELGAKAAQVVLGKPEEVMVNLAGTTAAATRMVDIAHQIAPDGKPLFGATERVKAEREAQKLIAEQMGQAWFKKQPDLLTAYDTWRKGEASIEIAGMNGTKQTMKLQEVLGENNYAMAEKTVVDSLKSQLALDTQINTVQDRAFKKSSDAAFADFSVAAQDGTLSLDTVESAKSQLEPEKFLALRTIAKSGGATVSDGATLNRLTIADVDGRDIKQELNTEYSSGKITRADYLKLYESNSKPAEGMVDPVSEQKTILLKSLGSQSQMLDFTQSLVLGRAEDEYLQRVRDFNQKEGRAPSYSETRDIRKDVENRYLVINTEEILTALPKPRFITPAEKTSPTSSGISEAVAKTNDFFSKKHNGNEAAMRDDPEYKDEAANLQKLFNIAQEREKNNADRKPK